LALLKFASPQENEIMRQKTFSWNNNKNACGKNKTYSGTSKILLPFNYAKTIWFESNFYVDIYHKQ
jgi:hypothetical protein